MIYAATLFMCFATLGQAKDKAKDKKVVTKKATAMVDEPTVELKTSMGTIVVKLFPQKAPVSVKNFLQYVDSKFYDNTVFHRVIKNFMIQGGGFLKEGADISQRKTQAGIINEARNGLKNKRGTIAMARKPMRDWSDTSSTTSQFFINVKDNFGLDYPSRDGFGYAVFGEVIKGMKVVDKIRGVTTGMKPLKVRDDKADKLLVQPMQDVPAKDVVILTARRIKK